MESKDCHINLITDYSIKQSPCEGCVPPLPLARVIHLAKTTHMSGEAEVPNMDGTAVRSGLTHD